MARATKPPKRNSWANAAGGSPDIEEAVYVDTGWPAPGGTPVIPPRGNFNYEQNRYDETGNYLMQRGISDWASDETDYGAGDIVRDTDGKFYVLTGTATTGTHPSADFANWQLWLKSPIAAVAQWSEAIWAWRNEVGQRGSGIDLHGHPTGRFRTWQELWDDSGQTDVTGTGTGTFGRNWRYLHHEGSFPSSIKAMGPWPDASFTRPNGALVDVGVTGTGEDSVALLEAPRPLFLAGVYSSFSMEFEFSIGVPLGGSATPQSSTTWAIGFADGSLVDGGSVFSIDAALGSVPSFACIAKRPSDTTWSIYQKGTGIAATNFSTSEPIALYTPYRYRLDYIPGGRVADGNYHVIHRFGSSVGSDIPIVAHYTSGLSGGGLIGGFTQLGKICPFIRASANAGETIHLYVSPMRINYRIGFNDTLF